MFLSRARVAVVALGVVLGACATVLAPGGAAAAPRPAAQVTAAVGPFTEPSFAAGCVWHSYGEGQQPPAWLMFTDPLCVEYAKRDITVDDGGALRFLLAEPARFAIALTTCRYYQKDHWSVQGTTGATGWVAWNGQYWWDLGAGRAGARLTDFRIEGRPVGIGDAVAALRAGGFSDVADVLDAYGSGSGESGATVSLPPDPLCAPAG